MSWLKQRMMQTTVLTPVSLSSLTEWKQLPFRTAGGGTVISGGVIENGGIGILMVRRHVCPPISAEQLKGIDNFDVEYITRHIEGDYLEAALKGYFRLGTLVKYRASEKQVSGRLGDPKESRQQDEFKSRSGFFQNAHVGGVFVAGTSFSNVNRQIVVETVVNAYCSCSSVGEFNEERGIAIRNNEIDEIKKPTAYVTYKLSALRDALACRIREREGLDNLTLLGRKVIYGEKDRLWDVEESFVYQKQRDAIALWLGTTFIKSRKFTHEEEFRLIAIDLARAGGLPEDSEAIVIEEDAAIAASIVAHSYY